MKISPLLAATKETALAVGVRAAWVGRRCHRFVHEFEPWGIVLTLLGVVLTMIGVAIALITIMVELEDRQDERTFRAWQTVLIDRSAGSSRREALESLNRQFNGLWCRSWVESVARQLTGDRRRRCLIPRKTRESLARIELAGDDLSGVYLPGADLTDADLKHADLRGAFLLGANLQGADLTDADLTDSVLLCADLRGADLKNADLRDADLRDGIVPCADVKNANLTDADLTGANLAGTGSAGLEIGDQPGVPGLTQEQLDAACGHGSPMNVPVELKWRSRPCPDD